MSADGSYFIKLRQSLEKKGVVFLDVREKKEREAGYLAGSLFCPLSDLLANKRPAIDDLECEIYTYCRSGYRSFTAKAILDAFGYKNVVALSAGLRELAFHDFPLNN
ncbi:MAG: rhodanese-like domain-containing protein [SAR324 cluster bacterium]|nr:rhodanese-like domain-containing protein [SAR324 cluster bacterium]